MLCHVHLNVVGNILQQGNYYGSTKCHLDVFTVLCISHYMYLIRIDVLFYACRFTKYCKFPRGYSAHLLHNPQCVCSCVLCCVVPSWSSYWSTSDVLCKTEISKKMERERAEPYYDYISHSDRIETYTNMSYANTAPPPIPMNTLTTTTE